MMSNGLERKGRDKTQIENSIFARRFQAIEANSDRMLETRRNKLYDLLRYENAKLIATYCDKLKAKETAHKEAIIKEAVRIQELIRSKNVEIADRERARLFNQHDEEYRLGKSKMLNMIIKKDQEAIEECKRQQRAYDKARESELLQQGDGFSLRLSIADENRKQVRTVNNKCNQEYLRQQVSETEKKQKLNENQKLEDRKILEDAARSEAEAQRQKILQKNELKRQIRKGLETQIEESKVKTKQNEKADRAIEKLVRQIWMPFSKADLDRNRTKELNRQAKLFMLHQQRIQDHRKSSQLEADKKISQISERCHLEHLERKKANQCYLQNLKNESLEAHRFAAVEEEINQKILTAQRIEQEAKERAEIQRRDMGNDRELKVNEEFKRTELRTNLDKQLEGSRLRRELEDREKGTGDKSCFRAS